MTDNEIAGRILARETSKFTDNPADRGGPTKWGITLARLALHRGHAVTALDVEQLEEPEARAIVIEDFIVAPGLSVILDGWLRWVVADAAVNHGALPAKKLLQRALGVKDDGVWGAVTLQALAQADQGKLAVRFCTARARLYAAITRGNLEDKDHDGIPDNVEFIAGWIDRAMDQVEELVAVLT